MSKFICRSIVSTVLCILISLSATAQLEINEIIVDSGNDGVGPNSNEWVELINNSASTLDIGCTSISDGDFSVTIPFGTILAPGASYLIGSGASTSFTSTGIVPDTDWSTCNCVGPTGVLDQFIGSFTNTSEQLLIFDATGQPTDGVVWGGSNIASASLTTLGISGCPSLSLNFAAGVAVTETIAIVTGESNALDCSGNYYNDPNATPGYENSDVTPVPNIVASTTTICQGGSVTFDATSSILSPTGTVTWSIPGTAENNSNPLIQTYSFPSATGSITATLTATNSCGNIIPTSITVTIQQPPTITFAATIPAATSGDYDICTGESFDLTATTTGNVQWLLNGANISGANSTTLTIDAAGSYTLTTVDALCTVTSTPVTVHEIPLPVAGITNTDLEVCVNEPLVLNSLTPFTAYSWLENNIPIGNAASYNLLTNTPGTYHIQLVVTDQICDSPPLDITAVVNAFPTVGISPSGPIDLCPDDQIILSSVNNHDSYEWFLDGVSYATSPTINVSYNLAASASLTATDNGCTSSSTPVDFPFHQVATLATWTPPPYAINNTLRTCLADHPILASSNGQQFQWYVDGNAIIGETSLSLIALQDGNYYYSASIDGFCPIYSDTISVDLEVDMTIETTASEDTACQGEIVQLIPEGEFVSYSWQGGIQADTLSVTNSGLYVVTGHLVSCNVNDTVSVFFSAYPQVSAGNDFFSDCEDFTLLFGSTNGDESYWEIDDILVGSGDTITIETPRRTSDLVLISSLNGCEARDTVNMKVDCIYIFAPTAITPDGDGLNDVFRVYANGLSSYILRIYNRYGQVVFETTDPEDVWTGGFNDYFLPNGVYTWQIEALDYNQQEALSKARSKGSILVVR